MVMGSKKKEEPKKDLVVNTQATNELALPEDVSGSWGSEGASSDDIIIPKALLMHGQSKKVQNSENSIGQIIRSTTGEVLAERNEKFRVIPFKMWKTWRISEINAKNNKAEWRGEEPWTAENTDAPWEYEVKDEKGFPKKMRRDQAYNFYVILVDDLGEGKYPFPLRLQFVRTSRKAGAAMADWFAQSARMNQPPAKAVWEIGSEMVQGKDESYLVFTANKARLTELEELRVVKDWWSTLSKAKNVRDHEAVDDEAIPTSGGVVSGEATEY